MSESSQTQNGRDSQERGATSLLEAAFASEVFRDPAKMILLLNASKALASTTDLDQLLDIIVSEVQHVLGCDGAAVVLYDSVRDDFYWRTVQDKQGLLAPRENISGFLETKAWQVGCLTPADQLWSMTRPPIREFTRAWRMYPDLPRETWSVCPCRRERNGSG